MVNVHSKRDVPGIGCLVLAAGEASRFGGPKQLAQLNGIPLLEHALERAANSGFSRVVVVLGANADRIVRQIDLHSAQPVVCRNWHRGISESLRAGIAELDDLEAALILLGDQPLVTNTAIARVIAARDPSRVASQATYDGRPGHPVLVERALFGRIESLRGDTGARKLLMRDDVTTVPCEDIADPIDVDTPEDLSLAADMLS